VTLPMPIDFVPTLAIALSLVACALLPVYLLALSHKPLAVAAPGRRFVLAASLACLSWLVAMIIVVPDWIELITGGLLLATATLAGFTLWTLIAWGFTLSMLLALAHAAHALTPDEWALAYTRGKPLDMFARDRLGVLFRLGLAEIHEGEVAMTQGRGRLVARISVALRTLFGLPT